MIVKRLGLVALVVVVTLRSSAHGLAQPSPDQLRAPSVLALPRLCMPVSYRQPPSTDPIRTKIGMLGDRYHQVHEALNGWNESGVPLVGHTNSGWEPVPCGDDSGLFYFVPLLARGTGLSADASLNVFLIGLIVLSAIAAFFGLLLATPQTWKRLLSLVPLLAGSWLSYKMGDLYVVQASLVLALTPWFIYGAQPGISPRRRFMIAGVAGILLGLGQWLRADSAAAPLVFFASLLWFSRLRIPVRLVLGLTALAGMSIPLLYARWPLHERDHFLVRHNASYQSPLNHHLVWHAAYLGLAYLNNPYVSAWRDSVAVEYVQSIDPAAIYGGQEYEDLLRSRVQEIARRDPKFIFYTLAAKSGVLIWILLLCMNVGLAASIIRPKPAQIETAFWIAIIFAALPGLVAIPFTQYVIGMIVLSLYYWYYSICFYIENGGSRFVEGRRLADHSGERF